MPGRSRFEAFVSGALFWSYFVLGEIKKRDMTSALLLDSRAGGLIPATPFEEK